MSRRPDFKGKGKPEKKKLLPGRPSRCGKSCAEKSTLGDYRVGKPPLSFTPERGKVLPRRTSGVCAVHQRMLVEAIKRARNIALLPFATD